MDQGAEQKIAQYLATEHFTLQGARNTLVSDTNGTLSVYLAAVSGGIIALAFVAQISGQAPLFLQFSVLLFPILIYVGVSALVRLVILTGAYALYTQAMNRIRNFYATSVPEIKPYLSFPFYDDNRSIDRASFFPIGFRAGVLLSPPALVAMINSFLVAVFLTILVSALLEIGSGGLIGTGVVGFVVAALLHARLAFSIDMRGRELFAEYRFPPPQEGVGE